MLCILWFLHPFLFYSKSGVISAMNVDLDAESPPHKRRKINEEVLLSIQVWKFLLLRFWYSKHSVLEQCSDSQPVTPD